jgi:serine/threonine protein kinase
MSQPPQDADRAQLVLQAGLRVFGRYTLTTLVGEGGMGVVWSARDETLGRDVALKFLADHVRRDPEAVRDLKRETNRSLALTHENIVRVYTFEEDAQAAAIVMEYVSGRSLAGLKAARPGGCFDVTDLAPLVSQICAALDYAHAKAKVVHRDLKPGNLLVTGAGILKVVDFGIARSFQDTETRLTAVMQATTGTLSYMSPQQLAGSRDEPAHDIYSLGATLYDLLTGKAPFYKGDIAGQIRESTPAPMNERRMELENTGAPIPVEWETAIFACLEKESARRPANAGAVAQAFGLQYVALRTSSPFQTQGTETHAATAVFPLTNGGRIGLEPGVLAPAPPAANENPATPTGQPAHKPATGKRGIVLLAAGVAAALIVGLGGYFVFRNSRAPARPSTAESPIADSPVAGHLPAAPAAESGARGKNSTVKTAVKTAAPVTRALVLSENPAVKASTSFLNFVAEAKISTVIAGPPSRAVINGKIVNAGDTVDATLGIVFDSVVSEQRAIFFKDKSGAIVTRKY